MKLFRRTKSSTRKEQCYKQQFSQLYFITIELIKFLLSYLSLLLTSFFFLLRTICYLNNCQKVLYVVFTRITIIYWTSKSIPNFCGRFPWIGDFHHKYLPSNSTGPLCFPLLEAKNLGSFTNIMFE